MPLAVQVGYLLQVRNPTPKKDTASSWNVKFGVSNVKFGVSNVKFGVSNVKFGVKQRQIWRQQRQVWRQQRQIWRQQRQIWRQDAILIAKSHSRTGFYYGFSIL